MSLPPPAPRLQDQFRAVIRLHHYSIRTEKSYWYWIRYFIRFHKLRHPLEMGPAEVNAFLTWLAVERHVAAATQNQALNAIVFLYAKVLEKPLGEIGDVVRVKRPARIPTVFTHAEAMEVISLLDEPYRLLASLMVWRRTSSDRSSASASQGSGLRSQCHHGPQWQGCQG